MHIKLLIIRYISKVKLKGESKGGRDSLLLYILYILNACIAFVV